MTVGYLDTLKVNSEIFLESSKGSYKHLGVVLGGFLFVGGFGGGGWGLFGVFMWCFCFIFLFYTIHVSLGMLFKGMTKQSEARWVFETLWQI